MKNIFSNVDAILQVRSRGLQSPWVIPTAAAASQHVFGRALQCQQGFLADLAAKYAALPVRVSLQLQ